MGKIFIFISTFLFLNVFCQVKKLNKIDSLTTVEDFQNFANKYGFEHPIKISNSINYKSANQRTPEFIRSVYQFNSDSLNVKSWQKADFDGNGLTDLLLVGEGSSLSDKKIISVCFLDKGKDIEVKKISKPDFYEEASFPIVVDNKIIYYNYQILNRYGSISNLQQKNLVYKFGDFIEENKSPTHHNILEIKFENYGGRWGGDIFTIEIISNRDAVWIAKNDSRFNSRSYNGTYTAKINEQDFKELIDLLNYIDFENLNDQYSIGASDFSTVELSITYDNLKTKKIKDYGLMGTRGLERLYKLFSNLKINTNWGKVQK